MADEAPETGWERGWEGHEKAQLKRWAKMSLSQKIDWLEQAQSLARQIAGAQSRRPLGAIARVVRIAPLEDIDEGQKSADYRAGCLALSPKERIMEMRLLSRR